MAKRISLKNAPTPKELSEVWHIIANSGDLSMSSARINQAVKLAVSIGAMRPEVADAAKVYAVYGSEVLLNRQSRMLTGLPESDKLGSSSERLPQSLRSEYGQREHEEVVPEKTTRTLEEDIPSGILKVVKASLTTEPGSQLYLQLGQKGEEEGTIPQRDPLRPNMSPVAPRTREEAFEMLRREAIPVGGGMAKIQDAPEKNLSTGGDFDFTRGPSGKQRILTPEDAREAEKLARRRIELSREKPKWLEGRLAASQEDEPDAPRFMRGDLPRREGMSAIERRKMIRSVMERAQGNGSKKSRIAQSLSMLANLAGGIPNTQDIEPQSVLGTAATRVAGGARGVVRMLLDALSGGKANSPHAKSRQAIAKRLASDRRAAATEPFRTRNSEGLPGPEPKKISVAGGTAQVERVPFGERSGKRFTPAELKVAERKAGDPKNVEMNRASKVAEKILRERFESQLPATYGPTDVFPGGMHELKPHQSREDSEAEARAFDARIALQELRGLALKKKAEEATAAQARRAVTGGATSNRIDVQRTPPEPREYVAKGRRGEPPALLQGSAARARRRSKLEALAELGKIPTLKRVARRNAQVD